MRAMYPETGREVVGNGRGRAPVDELDRDRVGVGKGSKAVLEEDRRIDEGAGGARVDQRKGRDGLVAWDEEVHPKG